jgi:hypothetical protein
VHAALAGRDEDHFGAAADDADPEGFLEQAGRNRRPNAERHGYSGTGIPIAKGAERVLVSDAGPHGKHGQPPLQTIQESETEMARGFELGELARGFSLLSDPTRLGILKTLAADFTGFAGQGADGDSFAAARTGICTSAYFIQKGRNGEL